MSFSVVTLPQISSAQKDRKDANNPAEAKTQDNSSLC